MYEAVIDSSGGSLGIRDVGTLKSAIIQPRLTYDQSDLYPDIISKAAALCFSLVMNHPFIDGNKRIGHAAMETYLILNGLEIDSTVDEQQQIFLDLAAGKLKRDELVDWLKNHVSHIHQ